MRLDRVICKAGACLVEKNFKNMKYIMIQAPNSDQRGEAAKAAWMRPTWE